MSAEVGPSEDGPADWMAFVHPLDVEQSTSTNLVGATSGVRPEEGTTSIMIHGSLR